MKKTIRIEYSSGEENKGLPSVAVRVLGEFNEHWESEGVFNRFLDFVQEIDTDIEIWHEDFYRAWEGDEQNRSYFLTWIETYNEELSNQQLAKILIDAAEKFKQQYNY